MSTSGNNLSPSRTVASGRGWPEPSLLPGESAVMVMRTDEREWLDEEERQVAQVLLDKARREQVVMRATRTGPNVQAHLWPRDLYYRRRAYFFDITVTGRYGVSAVLPASCGLRGLGADGYPDAGLWLYCVCQDACLRGAADKAVTVLDADALQELIGRDAVSAVLGWDLAAGYEAACERVDGQEVR